MSKTRQPARRRVAVVTGTRADYGLLKPVMAAVADHKRLDLRVVATGMHLIKKFGYTVREIERDGWTLDARVKMQSGHDSDSEQALGLSRGLAGIADYLVSAKVDLVVVLGDRIEAMAGALAAVTTGKLLVHIHGGDIAPGDFDDSFRHAITKLAHVHCAATAGAKRRIIQMGEEPGRVHFVGAPGLDDLRQLGVGESRETKRHRSRQRPRRSALVVQHPIGRSADRERRTMTTILRTVQKFSLAPIVVYPNSDRGHAGIVEAIESYRLAQGKESLSIHRSLPRSTFLSALTEASIIVGNSSSGIIEAGLAGTATVNVGDRQRGREPNGQAVFDAKETANSIESAIRQALKARPIKGAAVAYGRRAAGPRIASIIAAVPLTDGFRRKVFTEVDALAPPLPNPLVRSSR